MALEESIGNRVMKLLLFLLRFQANVIAWKRRKFLMSIAFAEEYSNQCEMHVTLQMNIWSLKRVGACQRIPNEIGCFPFASMTCFREAGTADCRIEDLVRLQGLSLIFPV